MVIIHGNIWGSKHVTFGLSPKIIITNKCGLSFVCKNANRSARCHTSICSFTTSNRSDRRPQKGGQSYPKEQEGIFSDKESDDSNEEENVPPLQSRANYSYAKKSESVEDSDNDYQQRASI